MAKLSVNAAVKVYDVSRPTLTDHLKKGKISGEKDTGKGWQIDTAELNRAYQPRLAPGEKAPPQTIASINNALQGDLKAENERLRADLAVASALADERGKRLDQLVPLLTDQRRRRWWQF
jgi:hypothetical protein